MQLKSYLDRSSPSDLASMLGRTMQYLVNNWSRLAHYVEAGLLPIDNSVAERSIKPFAIQSLAWLFSDTPQVSVQIYSLVETALFTRLRHVLERLPQAYCRGTVPQRCHGNLGALLGR